MAPPNEDNDLSMFMLAHIAKHGRLDFDDYRKAWDVVMADGVVDDKERRILHRLIDILPPGDIPPDLKPRIDQLRTEYGI